MPYFNIVAETSENTVVTEYEPVKQRSDSYQSEDALEQEFIRLLSEQGYEYLPIHTEKELIVNLRSKLEELNNYQFSDTEWESFFKTCVANPNEHIVEKTRKIQEDNIQVLTRDDGSSKNITLIDKKNIHNNRLQVLHQYAVSRQEGAKHDNRYDVTVLVNGLPLVHIELKRRGVPIREAFNQIDRYQRESFQAGSGLFEYVQIFVISNGTNTKYYSNSTRWNAEQENEKRGSSKKKTSNSFEFTCFWADAHNRVIPDLIDFTKTFFAKHTILNILTRYCIFTSENMLMVMRPYQITATERILNRIEIANNYKKYGSIEGGGYIWHTTGSGKTLTSFKTARLASQLPYIDKVLFVVDRKDLDYQTMKEYNKFQPGAVNGSTNTEALRRNLESTAADKRICVTTIQKLAVYLSHAQKDNPLFMRHVVFIFDECHRSQFGKMHAAITRWFKNYHLFGFTGTPIFAKNARSGGDPELRTTQQAFGDCLHKYTVVNAIDDGNVLPFKIDYVKTFRHKDGRPSEQVEGIDTNTAWQNPRRIELVSEYILDHFDQKTKRDTAAYAYKGKHQRGFNAILACDSIPSAQAYYAQIKQLIAKHSHAPRLKVATIFTYAPNGEEDDAQGMLAEEQLDTDGMTVADREFLDAAIADYNEMFNATCGTDAKGFDNYYKDVSQRMKNRELDLLIVVDMFLTGFDAKTLNTLWVDKNLRMHGLIQAFSRTNRILNSVKTFGNIVCFRDLSREVDESLSLFGDPNAGGIVVLKPYEEYFKRYVELLARLRGDYPLDAGFEMLGEESEKDLVKTFSELLRLRNVLASFDQFSADDPMGERELQDYQSHYLDLADKYKRQRKAELASIGDDLVFEMELVKSVEVNIDYILILVEQFHGDNVQDKEIADKIRSAVASSPELRDKADLIDAFLQLVGFGDDDPLALLRALPAQERHEYVSGQWREFVAKSMDDELDGIIQSENLKPEETRSLVSEAFATGGVPREGTAISAIMRPVSRFAKGNPYGEKRQRTLELLVTFYERFRSLTGTYPMDMDRPVHAV